MGYWLETVKSVADDVELRLTSLDTTGDIDFKPRPIEGTPAAALTAKPQSMLLNDQQPFDVSLLDWLVHARRSSTTKCKLFVATQRKGSGSGSWLCEPPSPEAP